MDCTAGGMLILMDADLQGDPAAIPASSASCTSSTGRVLCSGLRRYVVGTSGRINPSAWGIGWQPPLPPISLLVFVAVVPGITYGLPAVTLRILAPTHRSTVDGVPLLERPRIPVR